MCQYLPRSDALGDDKEIYLSSSIPNALDQDNVALGSSLTPLSTTESKEPYLASYPVSQSKASEGKAGMSMVEDLSAVIRNQVTKLERNGLTIFPSLLMSRPRK